MTGTVIDIAKSILTPASVLAKTTRMYQDALRADMEAGRPANLWQLVPSGICHAVANECHLILEAAALSDFEATKYAGKLLESGISLSSTTNPAVLLPLLTAEIIDWPAPIMVEAVRNVIRTEEWLTVAKIHTACAAVRAWYQVSGYAAARHLKEHERRAKERAEAERLAKERSDPECQQRIAELISQ